MRGPVHDGVYGTGARSLKKKVAVCSPTVVCIPWKVADAPHAAVPARQLAIRIESKPTRDELIYAIPSFEHSGGPASDPRARPQALPSTPLIVASLFREILFCRVQTGSP